MAQPQLVCLHCSAIMSQTELSMPDLKKSNRDQDTFTEMQEDRKTKDAPESTHV